MHSLSLLALISVFNLVGLSSGAIIHSRNRGTSGSHSSGSSSNNVMPNGMTGSMPFYDMSMNMSEYEDLHDEQALISRLLWNYDPAARPVYNASHPVVVKFSFALIQLCDMDERNQVLTTNVWLENEWVDERLLWNRSDYNNLDKIRIPCNRLWLPDIVLYNSADDYTEGYMQAKALVGPDGSIFWSPPAKLRSSCKIDVTYFPFDDQACFLKFGSWTYSGLQLDLVNRSQEVDLINYVPSGEWELRGAMIERNVEYYPCCPDEPYYDVHFYIFVRRKILYYLFNIILPCIWLSILSVIGFWLPPDSGEKVTLGITVLLAFSVFMLLIAENIPATSETVPLIGIYLTAVMSLTSISIIFTVFVLQLHHSGQFAPAMPPTFYKFTTVYLASCVFMRETVRRFEATRLNVNKEINKFKKTKVIIDKNSNKEALKTTLIECKNNFNQINYDLGKTIENKKGATGNLLCLSCLGCCLNSNDTNEAKQGESPLRNGTLRNSEIRLIRNNLKKNTIASYNSRDMNSLKQNYLQNNMRLIHHENNKFDYDMLDETSNGKFFVTKQPILPQKSYKKEKDMIDIFNSRQVERNLREIYSSQQNTNLNSSHINSNNNQLNYFLNKIDHNESLNTRSPGRKADSLSNKQQQQCKKCTPNSSTLPRLGSRSENPARQKHQHRHQQQQQNSRSNRNSSSESLGDFSTTIKKFIEKQDQVVENTNLQNEWKLCALIFDRCLFYVFTVLISFTSILLLVVVPMQKGDKLEKPKL